MERGPILMTALAALLAAGACDGDAGEQAQPGSRAPAGEVPATAPPSAEALRAEGMYQLARINDDSLPGLVQETDGCRVEVVDGSLRLEAGRFAFQNRTRELCDGAAPRLEPVMHAAGGTYRIEGGTVVLDTDVGDAFSQARGTVDSTAIILQQMSTDAGTETIVWHLERGDVE